MPRTRPQLTRERIAVAALTLVDDQGLDALTMRSLAASLGCDPMALYRYVKSRNDLLRVVVSTAIAEIRIPASTDDDRAWLRECMMNLRETCLRHPHVVSLIGHSLLPNTDTHQILDVIIDRLSRVPLPGVSPVDRINAVIGAIVGYVMVELSAPLGYENDWGVPQPLDPQFAGVVFGYRPTDRIVLAEGGFELLVDTLLDRLVGPSLSKSPKPSSLKPQSARSSKTAG